MLGAITTYYVVVAVVVWLGLFAESTTIKNVTTAQKIVIPIIGGIFWPAAMIFALIMKTRKTWP